MTNSKLYRPIKDFCEEVKMSLDEILGCIEENKTKLKENYFSFFIDKKYGVLRDDLDSKPLSPKEEKEHKKKLREITEKNKSLGKELEVFGKGLPSIFKSYDKEIIKMAIAQIKKGEIETDYVPEYDEPKKSWKESEVILREEMESFLEISVESIVDALKNSWQFRIGRYEEFVFYSEVEDLYYQPKMKARIDLVYIDKENEYKILEIIRNKSVSELHILSEKEGRLKLKGEEFKLTDREMYFLIGLKQLMDKRSEHETEWFSSSEIYMASIEFQRPKLIQSFGITFDDNGNQSGTPTRPSTIFPFLSEKCDGKNNWISAKGERRTRSYRLNIFPLYIDKSQK